MVLWFMNPLFWDMIRVVQYAVAIVSKNHTSIIIFMDLEVLEECQAGLGGKMHVSRWWLAGKLMDLSGRHWWSHL